MRDYESTLKQARTCANRKYCDIGGNCEYYAADVCCQGGEKDILNDAAGAIEELLKENGELENSGRVLMAAFARAKEKMPQWISVEERLPEPFVSVLVQMPGKKPCPTVREGYIDKEGKWTAGMFRREPGEVTHWAEMPAPPKEETE